MLSKKAGIQPKEAKEYVVANLQILEHKEILEALLFSLQLIKSEKGLEGTQWTKPTCDFIKKEFEKSTYSADLIPQLEKWIFDDFSLSSREISEIFYIHVVRAWVELLDQYR